MSFRKSLLFNLLPALLFASVLGVAKAQELNCDKLREIVNMTASDSTLQSLRGEEKTNKYGKAKEYESPAMLWKPDGYSVNGQYIEYDEFSHRYVYNSIFDDGSTGGAEKELAKKITKMLTDCLGDGWIMKTGIGVLGDTVTYLKNATNYVVIEINNEIGTTVQCYNDKRNSAPKCITGDCGNYWGNLLFFTGDAYAGTFIDGTLSGMGRVDWYATKMSYEGSFVGGQLAGYGAMYDQN